MTHNVEIEEAKAWRPSRPPAHWAGGLPNEGKIVEVSDSTGLLGSVIRFFKRSFVRLVIGLGIFILAAIVYDNTVNFGSWTERQEKPKDKSRAAKAIPLTPE